MKSVISRLNWRFKRVQCYLHHKKKFPQAVISPRVSIVGNCVIGEGTQLHGNSHIAHTTIGSRSIIEDGSSVNESHLGHNVLIASGTSLTRADVKDYVKISHNCFVSDAQIGSYTYVAQETLVGNVTLGRFCSVGPRVIFGRGVHPTHLVSTSPVFYSCNEQCGISFADQNYVDELISVQVGHDVWIGAHAYLRDGVTIGHGAIVGAGAVVTKNVPPYAIVGGVPAKIIRYRFDEKRISKLLDLAWWYWSEEQLRQAQPMFIEGNVDSLSAQFGASK